MHDVERVPGPRARRPRTALPPVTDHRSISIVRTQIRRLAAALLAATGALHLLLAPEYLQEKRYIGALFILGGLTALAVAARLWTRHDRQAWALGALIAAGMAAGFVLSRSVGLPGFHESDWELAGIVSVLLEAGFIGALAWHRRAAAVSAGDGRALA